MSVLRTIAVLRGGPSSEFDVSIKTGEVVLRELSKNDNNRVLDILIDKQGQWHRNGLPKDPAKAIFDADVAVIAMHGEYGENGELQRILDKIGVPYTGSGAYESALAMHKPRARFHVAALPTIKMPEHYVVHDYDGDNYNKIAFDIFRRFGPPYIVKPIAKGSSVGLTRAKTFAELPQAIETVRSIADEPVLVEALVIGKELTCGVVEHFRGESLYSLPPVEIKPPANKEGLFDYESKYSENEDLLAEYICPPNLSKEEKALVEQSAKDIHKAMGLSHYSRSDFILNDHGLYFLEVNTLPGITEHSLVPTALRTVGVNLGDFLEHIITLAIEEK